MSRVSKRTLPSRDDDPVATAQLMPLGANVRLRGREATGVIVGDSTDRVSATAKGSSSEVRPRGALMPVFVETYRATVAPSDCDHLGHMNVQHYFAAVSDGMFAIMARLGLGPKEIRQRQISFAVVRAETDCHRELRPGDGMALGARVLALGEQSATF